ncbi:hypothetical protein BDD43_2101 [Mucilaginibacter gracilis]|uniref:Uncharacterized protein n=1 Tax=Mucilaginibacter gracilis TaxID=423350 RepID=A0A495J1H6_9SPHI|nr:hypothetical protein BDD43_2101 [Mucilaginibacter gracilis]
MAKLQIESNVAELQSIANEIQVLLDRFNNFELTVSVPFDPEVDSAETVNHYSSKA